MKDKKQYLSDLIYSIVGVAFLNGVLQVIVNPLLERDMGPIEFGRMLSMMSLATVLASTFGSAANYSRIISMGKRKVSNGDFNFILCGVYVLSIFVTIVYLASHNALKVCTVCALSLLLCLTITRYYADVEFRINTNYKRFSFYYILIGLGYLIGFGFYYLFSSWFIVIVVGEVLGISYVYWKGSIFKGDLLKRTADFRMNLKSTLVLSSSYLLGIIPVNADRLLLEYLQDGYAVTVFYVASLCGKIISLASMPLNGVVIGHITKSGKTISKKQFIRIGLIGLAVCFALNIVCVCISYVLVGILYPDIYDDVKKLFFIANLGQVFYFVSSTFTVILLKIVNEKYQIVINMVYLIVFMLSGVILTLNFGLMGFGVALLISNVFRYLVTVFIGIIKIDNNDRGEVIGE